MSGRVLNGADQPLEGALVSVDHRTLVASRATRTDAEGRYELGHVPKGTYTLRARLSGYENNQVDDVTVSNDRATHSADLRLVRAERISGQVIDVDGVPIADVRLTYTRIPRGHRTRARTTDDGSFRVHVPRDGEYALTAMHPDYEPWGEPRTEEHLVGPGSGTVTITMRRAQKARFKVLDPDGEPVTRFGLAVLENNGKGASRRVYSSGRRPPVQELADGLAYARAAEGIDLLLVTAEGFPLLVSEVEFDSPGLFEQTLRHEKGGTVRGRVVDGDRGVEDVDVLLELVRRFGDRSRGEVRVRLSTAADGSFEVTGLGSGQYRLTATHAIGAPHVRDDITVMATDVVDLGPISLGMGGTIEGVVIVPPGLDPTGITIRAGSWRRAETAVTDGAGRFRFENLSVGEHRLSSEGQGDSIEPAEVTTVEVREGETTAVKLDLAPFAVVGVEIRIVLDELDPEGLVVHLVDADAPEHYNPPDADRWEVTLERTNAEGIARGNGRSLGRCDVRLEIPGIGTLVHPTGRVNLEYGSPVSKTLDFELSTFEVEIGGGPELPAEGELILEFRDPEELRRIHRSRWPIEEGRPMVGASEFVELDGTTLRLLGLLPGRYRVDVFASAEGAPKASGENPEGSTWFGRERSFTRTTTVSIEPGRTVRMEP